MIKATATMTTMDGDTEPLFSSQSGRRGCGAKCWFLTSLTTAVLVGLFLAGYNYYWKDVVGIRVMSFNTWGIPAKFGSRDKEKRMDKIGEVLAWGEYDIILLEELWTQADHDTIKRAVSGSYHMTEYGDFNSLILPSPAGCSGLAIISRWKFIQSNFTKFTKQGDLGHILSDGEWLAGKGVGRAQVSPRPGIVVEVMVTHTISEDGNYLIREHQADEIVEHIENSKADFVILGGDFNASPLMDIDKTYEKVKAVMTDVFQEIMANLKAWFKEEFATFANPRNTYKDIIPNQKPVIYDYIFHKKKVSFPKSHCIAPLKFVFQTDDIGMIWAKWFYLPFLNGLSAENNTISLSDHEPVTSHLYLWKQQK